ncbi:MAG: hypothetical protein ABSG68_19850 [Thermoguttaceae bacterium]|jgi:hypothetical protein
MDGLTHHGALPGSPPVGVPDDVQALMSDLKTHYDAGAIQDFSQLRSWLLTQTRDRPITVAKMAGCKIVRCWYATDSHRHEAWLLLLQFLYGIPILLGGWRCWSRGGPTRCLAVFAWALVISHWLIAAMVTSILRFLVPVMPLLLLLVPGVFRQRQEGQTRRPG